MKKNNKDKIESLKVEIEIRDRLIGLLLKEIANKKVELPEYITSLIEILFKNKIKKEVGNNE